MKNEYGGCLPLELIDGLRNPFFQHPHSTWISGRAAIYAAVIDYGADTVWLPYYLCPSVKRYLEKWSIRVKEYHVNINYEPMLQSPILKNEMILWTNWYGCMERQIIRKVQKKFGKQVIIDNSQALFSFPNRECDSYFIYSCRKFLGVPDGAYLVKKNLRRQKMQKNLSLEGWDYLVHCRCLQSNAVYSQYSEHEKKLENQFQDMSELTKQYLNGIDWFLIKKTRKENMSVIHEKLRKFNLLQVDFQTDSCFMYPFMSETDDFHEYLIEKHIYVPRWWKHMLQNSNLLSHEYEWANRIVPLPIDQRYNKQDMEWIAEQVIYGIQNRKVQLF